MGKCRDCGKLLSACCRSGYCERCRRRHECGLCGFTGPAVVRFRCLACSELLVRLSGLDRGLRPPPHLRPGLVARYTARAALKLPLFVSEAG